MSSRKKYQDGDLTVYFEPSVCIHSEKCWRGLNSVFDPKKRPWIDPSAEDAETVIAQIKNCPSGALSYEYKGSTSENASETEGMKSVKVSPNGPLIIAAPVVIEKGGGSKEHKSGMVALCRCGESSNKPYCDGSHSTTGFEAD